MSQLKLMRFLPLLAISILSLNTYAEDYTIPNYPLGRLLTAKIDGQETKLGNFCVKSGPLKDGRTGCVLTQWATASQFEVGRDNSGNLDLSGGNWKVLGHPRDNAAVDELKAAENGTLLAKFMSYIWDQSIDDWQFIPKKVSKSDMKAVITLLDSEIGSNSSLNTIDQNGKTVPFEHVGRWRSGDNLFVIQNTSEGLRLEIYEKDQKHNYHYYDGKDLYDNRIVYLVLVERLSEKDGTLKRISDNEIVFQFAYKEMNFGVIRTNATYVSYPESWKAGTPMDYTFKFRFESGLHVGHYGVKEGKKVKEWSRLEKFTETTKFDSYAPRYSLSNSCGLD